MLYLEIDVLSLGRFGSFHEAVGAGLMVFQHFGVSFYLSHVFISAVEAEEKDQVDVNGSFELG